MNYIYDIVLNFQDNYYHFFEWKKEDKIKNIPQIPIYRITDKDLLYLKNNKIIISPNFIKKLKKDNNPIKKNICIFSNGKIALGALFNDDGTLKKRSSLIFEEEDEVLDITKNLKITPIDYLENITIAHPNKLRIEKEKKEQLIKYIQATTDPITLKYLYYEYYEKETSNPLTTKKILLKELTKEWNIKQNNLYNIVKLLTKSQ